MMKVVEKTNLSSDTVVDNESSRIRDLNYLEL